MIKSQQITDEDLKMKIKWPTTWQDWVIGSGQFLFFVVLLPSVFSDNKPHPDTSVSTGIILLVFAFTFWTLTLRWGAIMAALTGCTWLVLYVQVR